jgi:hypothetical protein
LSRSDIAQSIAKMNAMTSKGIPKETANDTSIEPASPQQQQSNDSERKTSPIVVEKHDDPNTSSRSKATAKTVGNSNNNKTALSKTLTRIQQQQSSSAAVAASATAASSSSNTTTAVESIDVAAQLFQSPWMLETLTEHQLEALIHQLDSDGDGSVTFNDLKESLMNA